MRTWGVRTDAEEERPVRRLRHSNRRMLGRWGEACKGDWEGGRGTGRRGRNAKMNEGGPDKYQYWKWKAKSWGLRNVWELSRNLFVLGIFNTVQLAKIELKIFFNCFSSYGREESKTYFHYWQVKRRSPKYIVVKHGLQDKVCPEKNKENSLQKYHSRNAKLLARDRRKSNKSPRDGKWQRRWKNG